MERLLRVKAAQGGEYIVRHGQGQSQGQGQGQSQGQGEGQGQGRGQGRGQGPGPGSGSGPGAHGDIDDVDASRGVDVGVPHESAGERRAAQLLPLEALEGGEELSSLRGEERVVRVPGKGGDSMSTSLGSG